MKVLVLEERIGESCDVALGLVGAGHQIVRCHGADEPAFPCRGMTDRHCPLDDGDVGVAVMVHSTGGSPVHDAVEDGARCALRRHVPLVVAGPPDRTRLDEWASAVVPDPTAVTGVVDAIGSSPSPRHTEVAEGAFAGVLEGHGLDPAAAVAVVRRDGADLRVELRPSDVVDRSVLEVAAVRVAGALRRFDPFARAIDVVRVPPR